MKLCTKCGGVKPLSEFYKRGTRYRAGCKECHKEIMGKKYKKKKKRRLEDDVVSFTVPEGKVVLSGGASYLAGETIYFYSYLIADEGST